MTSSAAVPEALANLRPSRDSALVIVVRLPPALDALRRRLIADASQGVPPHITLLYPFAEPAQISAAVLDAVAGIAAGHPPLAVRLTEGRRWPDTLYAAVEPEPPLTALQARLAGAFPSLPLYGGEHLFEPHVSIGEGPAVHAPGALDDPAWATLPVGEQVTDVDLITKVDGRWDTRHQFRLKAPAR